MNSGSAFSNILAATPTPKPTQNSPHRSVPADNPRNDFQSKMDEVHFEQALKLKQQRAKKSLSADARAVEDKHSNHSASKAAAKNNTHKVAETTKPPLSQENEGTIKKTGTKDNTSSQLHSNKKPSETELVPTDSVAIPSSDTLNTVLTDEAIQILDDAEQYTVKDESIAAAFVFEFQAMQAIEASSSTPTLVTDSVDTKEHPLQQQIAPSTQIAADALVNKFSADIFSTEVETAEQATVEELVLPQPQVIDTLQSTQPASDKPTKELLEISSNPSLSPSPIKAMHIVSLPEISHPIPVGTLTSASIAAVTNLELVSRLSDPTLAAGIAMFNKSTATENTANPEFVDTLTSAVAEDAPPETPVTDAKVVFEKMLQAMSSHTAAQSGTSDQPQATLERASSLATQTTAAFTAIDSAGRGLETQAPAIRSFIVQTSVPVPVGQPQWSQAVGEKVLWLAAQNVTAAEIHLHPEDLGPMQVKISINQDQTNVSFTSTHASVREVLDQNLSRLRDMFSEQGLNLVNVDVSDKSFQREQSENKHQQGQGTTHDLEEEDVTASVSAIVHKRLVDHYA